MILNYLEINNLIRKNNETELIKNIFLNENQQSIFQFLNKPSISNKSQTNFNTDFNYEEILNNDKKLIDSYLDKIDVKSRSDRSILFSLKKQI